MVLPPAAHFALQSLPARLLFHAFASQIIVHFVARNSFYAQAKVSDRLRLMIGPQSESDSECEPLRKKCKLEQGCQPLAAPLSEDPGLMDIIGDCQVQWFMLCRQGHPLDCLRQALQDSAYRTSVFRQLLTRMKEVHPEMPSTVMQHINLADAMQEGIGCSGEAHLFMAGYDLMTGLDWPVMWKGDPALSQLHSVWMRAIRSGKGLDTTARNLKLCVSAQMCNLVPGALAQEILFAGYTSGSTLGSGCLLLAYMLLNCKASPWQHPNVRAFMNSIARVKVTFVVHASPDARCANAWSTATVTNILPQF